MHHFTVSWDLVGKEVFTSAQIGIFGKGKCHTYYKILNHLYVFINKNEFIKLFLYKNIIKKNQF